MSLAPSKKIKSGYIGIWSVPSLSKQNLWNIESHATCKLWFWKRQIQIQNSNIKAEDNSDINKDCDACLFLLYNICRKFSVMQILPKP